MIVKVDNNDFVISVEREAVDFAMREIRRSDFMPDTTRVCKGPWHYNNGKGTPLPIANFPENRYKKGTLTKTCGDCLNKSGKRNATPLGVRAMTSLPTENTDFIAPPAINGGLMHKWEVTVVRATVVTVYAKDYLDAGVEAGEGEITNVRRLD